MIRIELPKLRTSKQKQLELKQKADLIAKQTMEENAALFHNRIYKPKSR